jgi:hypothetical protein
MHDFEIKKIFLIICCIFMPGLAAAAEPVTQTASIAVPITPAVSAAAPVTPAAEIAAQESVTKTAALAEKPVSVTQAAINADYAAAVTRAVQSSTAIKQALAGLNEAKALLEKEKGVSDFKFNAGVFYSDSDDKSLVLQQPESEKILKYKAGISGRLITGGDIALNFASSREALLFPAYSGSVDAAALRPSINPYYYPELMFSYTQPLLLGFLGDPVGKKIQAAGYRVKAAKERLKETILGLAHEIKKVYYELYLADISLKAVKNYARDVGSAYSSMKAAGRGEADLLLAKAAAISAGVLTRTLEKNLEACREKYLNIAGFSPDEWETAIVEPDETLEEVYIPEEMTKDLEDTLVSLQPAVAAEKFSALAAESESSAAEFLCLPRLSLTGGAGFNGVSGDLGNAFMGLSGGKYRDLMVGLDFTWDIPGMAGSGEAGAKKEALNRARAVFEAAENANRINIKSAYKGIKTEKEDYAAMKEARLLLERRVKLLQQSGAGGELLRAHFDRFNARKDEAAAFVAYAMSIADWNLVNGKYDAFYNEYVKNNY